MVRLSGIARVGSENNMFGPAPINRLMLFGGCSGLVRHQVDRSTYTQLLKSSIDARLLVRSDTSQGLEIANIGRQVAPCVARIFVEDSLIRRSDLTWETDATTLVGLHPLFLHFCSDPKRYPLSISSLYIFFSRPPLVFEERRRIWSPPPTKVLAAGSPAVESFDVVAPAERSDRIEVAGDAEERYERISDCDSLANDGVVDIGKEDAGGRSDGSAKKTRRLIPFLYRCDQPIEQLLDLPSRFLRLAVVQGQSWNGVLPTRSTFKNDWPSNVPCEETKGKRLKLPLMGKIPKSYPLQRHSRCSIGESFSAMTVAEEEDSDARGSPDGGIDASAGEALVEGAIDQVSDVRPSKKKKKKSKSSKRAKAGLEGEREQEVEINQVEDDRLTDEVEGNREAAQTNNFEDLIEDGQVEIFRIEEKRVG
ncbi:hypothetical protein F2Q68_00040324 [Brassica cretica]|uniref:Uncharacterized protein n=2 Tax=Brassica cretica TaxID=69181 RepID=A0ABQ7AK75_BRACR|nr:hypothetical protein F2Q68_00040324 [Brassica cretica]KAF3497980.1 hypothetical protein DY000_02054178 [Brassica cretica]